MTIREYVVPITTLSVKEASYLRVTSLGPLTIAMILVWPISR